MKSTPNSLIPILLGLFFMLFSCENKIVKSDTENKTKLIQSSDDTISDKQDSSVKKYNEISRLIAGLDSIPTFITHIKNRQAFSDFYNNSKVKYSKIEDSRLNKINKWCSDILAEANLPDSNFCFYPFAGGDFIHAHFLYPNANEYLLLALEPTGTLPDLHNYSEDEVLEYLNNLDTVLRNIYLNSYFITKNMHADIKKKKMLDGVLPLIVWGLAKAEYEITAIEHFDIDSLGNKIILEKNKANLRKSRGVSIEVKNGKVKKTISYVSADVSDDGLIKVPGIKEFFTKAVPMQRTTTFIKSASYLLHYNFFSIMRNLVLTNSSIIVQDDTGVPYRFLNQDKWNIKLYGDYKKPLKDFAENTFQNDLDSAYTHKINHFGNVPFSIGYHWNKGNQNQMFIYRK
jgi:hypothetical protein